MSYVNDQRPSPPIADTKQNNDASVNSGKVKRQTGRTWTGGTQSSPVNVYTARHAATDIEQLFTVSGSDDITSYISGPGVRLIETQGASDSSLNPLRTEIPETTFARDEGYDHLVPTPDSAVSRPSTPAKSTSERTRRTPPPSRATTPLPSASRIHWNQIRNAIKSNTTASSVRPNVQPNNNVPQPSVAALPRPQTPKPSKFARLGFRQIVDHTREYVNNEINKFEADIYQACVSARLGDIKNKQDRDGSQTGYLPFMSTASLPLSISMTTAQQSKTSLPYESTGRGASSLRLLHQTLLRYASTPGPSGTILRLPYESEVLAALLAPFLAPFMTESGNEMDECWLAVEAFEITIKAWQSSSQQREIDRILWCCKAALIPPSPVRSRVLGTLSNLLFTTRPVEDASPLSLQNIIQGLQLLLQCFSRDPQSSVGDIRTVRDLFAHVSAGNCGKLSIKEVVHEYGEEWGARDSEDTIRAQVIAEGVVRCLQNGSNALKSWILRESLEACWPSSSESWSPLCKKIMSRRMVTFIRSSHSLLESDASQSDGRNYDSDFTMVFRLLKHRAIVDLKQLPIPRHENEPRALVVDLLLLLLSTEFERYRPHVVGLFCSLYNGSDNWKECLNTGLRLLIEIRDWSYLTKVLQSLIVHIPDNERDQLMLTLFPALHARLIVDAPPTSHSGLALLCQSLVDLYPQQFYKPIFGLAAASKDPTIVGQLDIVTCLARHLPDFWIRDSEMITIALMSDVGSAIGAGKGKEGKTATWAKVRIGQSLIMLELIKCIKELTKQKKDPNSPPDGSQSQAYKFVTGLETRLAIMLEAKETTALVSLSQRTLLAILFLEIRLFTRSLKPAPWLKKIVTWATQSYRGASLREESHLLDSHETVQHIVEEEAFEEIMSTSAKIQSIYIACWQPPPSNSRQRSSIVFSRTQDSLTPFSGAVDQSNNNISIIKDREELTSSLSTGVAFATFRLLVATCALLSQSDHQKLGPVLWSHFMDTESPIIAPVCFLLAHCLEKAPGDTLEYIEADRLSLSSDTRQAFCRRLMTLFAWRSQLLTQTFISDRQRRRPFKLARQPISFVAIDVGSANYVHEQTEEDRKNLPGGSLPFELRKKLAEVGWDQDDQPTDTRMEKVRAPYSLFSASQLDHLNINSEHAIISPSRNNENGKQLLRRKSSTSHHHGSKRRPVFVPALVTLFTSMAKLAADADPIVASAAKEATLVMLRDDPVMFCRPVMDILSTDLSKVGDAVSMLRCLLHIHHRLPPSTSHHVFSHLGGFLKQISRDSDDPKALRAFAYTIPVLAKLITQVSNLTIRDLRRAKFEIYVFPSGSLWFPQTAPSSIMFPQSLGPMINPFDELPSQLVAICMIRTAQNMLLLDMLKHKPQEVHTVRKGLTGLALPGENTGKELDVHSFLPKRTQRPSRTRYQQVSLALSRSHLLLLEQVFRSMPRNFSGKAELSRLFDGLNRILLAHSDDIGIVAHFLIACMIGVTRFKRFISSSGGFSLFMPSLLKVYCEAENHAGIRIAIQYASSRFYAIHREGYLFQSVDLASKLLVKLDTPKDQNWFAGNIWHLFSDLKAPPHRGLSDAACIHDCNKTEERESLIASTFTDEAPMSVAQESPRGEQLKKILAVGQYETTLLQLDDLVKLFLTVIAHDPTAIRSQNFLCLFHRMAPDIYNGSKSARTVLREGIDALGSALFPKASRQKVYEGVIRSQNNESLTQGIQSGLDLFEDSSSPCDHIIMRREYLSLIAAFTRAGGDLRQSTIRIALDLVKGLLKEPTRLEPEFEGSFLHELTEGSLLRMSTTVKQALSLLRDIAPVIRAFALSVDCSGILDVITDLLRRPEFAKQTDFVQFVVDQIAGSVLEVCEEAASDNLLISLPIRRSVVLLVSQAAVLGNANMHSIIEKRVPSPGFLSGIILPLCMTIKTSVESAAENQWQTNTQSNKRGIVFIRLLAYVMDACRRKDSGNGRSSPLPNLNRRDSERSKTSSIKSSRAPLATLAISIQIIKVIVIRAANDLSIGLSGIWVRIAQFMRQLLIDGNARFALPSGSSPIPSPWQSPKLSPSLSNVYGHSPSVSTDGHFPSSTFSSTPNAPRVVDYLTWSLLEFLCCASSPLTLQMRLWMQEKVHDLDTELKSREVSGSPYGRRSRRLSSSVFSRPRGSSMSPDALHPSRIFLNSPSELNLASSISTDFNTHNRFPSLTSGSLQPSWNGRRIIHLGPTENHPILNAPERSNSQDSYLRNLARNDHVTLLPLIRTTHTRIRLVQTCMGYDRLLPSQEGEVNLKAWTKASALAMLAEETKMIMDEFSENFHETVGGAFVDVPPNSDLNEKQPLERQPSSPTRNRRPILF